MEIKYYSIDKRLINSKCQHYGFPTMMVELFNLEFNERMSKILKNCFIFLSFLSLNIVKRVPSSPAGNETLRD